MNTPAPMDSAARGIFLCPKCGAAAVSSTVGTATCSSCSTEFETPKEQQTVRPNKPLPSSPAKGGAGMVRRNITLGKSLDGLGFARTEEQPPFESRLEPKSRELEGAAVGPTVSGGEPPSDGPPMERRRRKKKRSRPAFSVRAIILMSVAWIGIVGLIFFVVIKFQQQLGGGDELSKTLEQRLSGEEKAFFRAEYPAIQKQLVAFLRSDTPELKTDYSLKIPRLGRMMRRYYIDQSDETFPPTMQKAPLFWNVAFEESPGFVEVVFDAGGKDFIEAVFVKEDNDWLLDWEHFVRYSTQNWTLFHRRAGNDQEGTFRVYVEKVSESQQKEAPWVKIRLYGAHTEERRRKTEASEVIMIEGDDPLARKVDHLFIDRDGESAGFSKLWKRDPKELRRATLKLAWVSDAATGEDSLVLKEILSHHWRTGSALLED